MTPPVLNFEGHPITAIEYRGRPMVLPREVGAALGYANPGLVAKNVGSRWTEDLVEGRDHFLLDGDELALFRGVVADRDDPSLWGGRLLLLTESGAQLVAMLSRTPRARAFRRWIVDVLIPEWKRLHTAPPPSPAPLDEDLVARVAAIAARTVLDALGGRDADADTDGDAEVDLDRLGSDVQRARELRHLAGRYRRVKQPAIAVRLEARAAALLLGEPGLDEELVPAPLRLADEEDPWTEPIQKWLAGITRPFKLTEVLCDALYIEPSRQDSTMLRHAGRVLRALGYETHSFREPGGFVHRWWRPPA